MMGGAMRALYVTAGLLCTLRRPSSEALLAAAEGSVLWGWDTAKDPGPGPAGPPPTAEGPQAPSPHPVGAGRAADPTESEDSSWGAAGPPAPPPPDHAGPSAETSWREGWRFFPEVLGYWRVGYHSWIRTPVSLAWVG